MKKFLIIFAIAGTLAACNNSSEGSTSGDSVITPVDTNNLNTPEDTSHLTGDTSRMMTDTSRTSADSVARK